MKPKEVNPERNRVQINATQARFLAAVKARKDIQRMQPGSVNSEDTDDHAEDNPALSNVIERNIRTIIGLRLKAARERNLPDRIADAVTSFSGRLAFVYVHIVWF